MDTEKTNSNKQKIEKNLIEEIIKELKSIRYGYVQITVQDAKVVQIDKVEKFRLNQALGWYT